MRNPRTTYGGWVADPADHLQVATRDSLNRMITRLERENGAEIAVVVVDATSGFDTRTFAVKLHNLWGVGKKGRDNGVLVLWVPYRRSVFVSVGYGLEEALPDRWVGNLLAAHLFPAFRRGEFDQGMLATVGVLDQAIRRAPVRPPRLTRRLTAAIRQSPALVAAAAVVAGSAAWLVRAYHRSRPRRCPKCGQLMRVLGQVADDTMLEGAERVEETLGSVDYDVWVCDGCGERLKIPYARWLSGYGRCPSCGNKTLKTAKTTVEAAAAASEGIRRVRQRCAFCSHEETYEEVIPRRSRSGWGGGRGFGGGRAGGGGAGGRY